ncbi:hypothetical protein [Nonomuraea zeae]|uniref:DUF1109 domain-containing protein n=1 Tax=Nonomuraea zeae TaxID=1642303 RepID=A0A5S4GU81_9ACTN|nr:hypothetical protein [Nonomuraea zeae]TMR36496.1 hypothetical protein ETD85_10955 [Nonomuraea zeae]
MDLTDDLPDASRRLAPTNVNGRAWGTVAVLLGLGTIYATSVPGWHFMWLMLVAIGWLLFGGGWLIVLGASLVRRGRRGALRRNWRFWAVPPLVVALVGSLVYVGAPVRMRFELSRGSLDLFAKKVSEGTSQGKRNRIGLYPVKYLEGSRRAFGFMIEDAGLFGSYGFAWSPNGEPDIDSPGSYRHLDGPWYIWIDEW